jgi:ATP-dependent helicase/nuclease subunit A
MTDHTERLQALDPQQSFIVSAPAGSGKTGLITQRLLGLLCTVQNPEEILCITFTKKAAGEMASRVHSALRNAAYKPRPTDSYEAQTWELASAALARNKELAWGLLEMPARLRIQTIDGFCRYVASQFALETSLGELPEPIENPESLYEATAREMLDSIEEDSETGRQLRVLVAHTGNDMQRCEKLLADMLKKRDQWLPYIFHARDNHDYFQQVIEQTIGQNLLQLEIALAPIAGELLALADFAAQHLPENSDSDLAQLAGIEHLPEASLEGIAQWKLLLSLLVTQTYSPRKKVDKNVGFPADKQEAKASMMELLAWYQEHTEIHEAVAHSCHLPDADITQPQQALLDALGHLLPLLAGQLNRLFLEKDTCDYTAIMLASLQALEQSPEDEVISDITLRLDYQLRHILVDEFQDTSGSQISLLEHLIAGWQPEDGRTLFLVGDAMQSLYRFRNANVGLFLNAQRYPIGTVQCIPLSLSTNFRSQKGIIAWVNQAFSAAFPPESDSSRGAIPYSPSVAFKDAEDTPAVSFSGFTAGNTDQYKEAEAQHIARQCRTLADTNSQQSIAILVRSRNLLNSIVPALREAKLDWQAIEITSLASRMPVVDMLSLTRALISPADRIAWLALLRAPFCGLGLADLLLISNSGDHSLKKPEAILDRLQALNRGGLPAGLSEAGRIALQRVIPILLHAWHSRGRDSLRNTVESLWTALGGPATINISNDLTDVRTYLDLLEKWQVAGRVPDWAGFQQAASKLHAAPSVAIANPYESGPVIQIMTIYKAKGLEFDHVFLPGLNNTSGQNDKPLLRWHEQVDENNETNLMMATLGAHDEEDDSVYQYLKYEDSVKSRLENTRILYVAATRAIRGLYLYATLTPSKDSYNIPAKGTLLAPIWATIKAGINAGEYSVTNLGESDFQATNSIKTGHTVRRLPSNFTAHRAPGAGMSFGTESNGTEEQVASQADGNISIRARHLGTVLHRTLKQIANEGVAQWPNPRLQKLNLAWGAQLKQLGIAATEEELKQLGTALDAMLADSTGQWILQQHSQAQCEQSLGYIHSETNTVATSIIDRSFVDKGVRWIIDYKMSQPGADESEQHFAKRQICAYQPQLKHYANLYRSMESNPVRCALYFPQMPMFIEVNAD